METQKSLVFTMTLLLSLTSCGNQASPAEELAAKARRFYHANNGIDSTEKQKIIAFVSAQKTDFPEFFDASGNVVLEQIDVYLADFIAKTTGQAQTVLKPATPALEKINLYVDDTGSMRRFVNGNTTFQETLGDFITRVETQYDKKLSINTINSGTATPLSGTPGDFIRQLTRKVPSHNKKAKSHPTEILDIVSRVIDNVAGNQITILFSDFNSNPPPTNANLQKTALTHKLSSKLKADGLAVLLIQFISENADKPPYYALILAKQNLMQDLTAHINVDKLAGFQSKIGFKNLGQGQTIDFSVLSESFKKGSFRPDRDYREKDHTRHLTSLDYDRQGHLQFAVAVNFSPLYGLVSDDYLTDIDNFAVSPFVLNGVHTIADNASAIADRDKITIKEHGFTHYLLVETKQGAPLSDLTIELTINTPQWDGDNSNLRYLMEAIANAYKITNNDKNTLVNLTVGIKE